MARVVAIKSEAKPALLDAAKKILRQNGYSGLSTRDVATAAGVPKYPASSESAPFGKTFHHIT